MNDSKWRIEMKLILTYFLWKEWNKSIIKEKVNFLDQLKIFESCVSNNDLALELELICNIGYSALNKHMQLNKTNKIAFVLFIFN